MSSLLALWLKFNHRAVFEGIHVIPLVCGFWNRVFLEAIFIQREPQPVNRDKGLNLNNF